MLSFWRLQASVQVPLCCQRPPPLPDNAASHVGQAVADVKARTALWRSPVSLRPPFEPSPCDVEVSSMARGGGRELEDNLDFTQDNSDSGWVTTSGVGAYQLRIGQPPGSKEALVRGLCMLCAFNASHGGMQARLSCGMLQVVLPNNATLEPFSVQLYEAKAGDPKVPQGKPFAVLSTLDLGLPEASKITCALSELAAHLPRVC